jgi:hypothetical protein
MQGFGGRSQRRERDHLKALEVGENLIYQRDLKETSWMT